MHAWLRGYAEALIDTAVADGSVDRLAEELSALYTLICGTSELSRVISDVGVSSSARVAVMDDLLEDRVGQDTLGILVKTLSTERADACEVALEQLVELAHHRANHQVEIRAGEEVPDGEFLLSRYAERSFLAGYAAALLEGVAVAEIERAEGELFAFSRVIEANPALGSALADRSLPRRLRQGILEDLLAAQACPSTMRLAGQALRSRTRSMSGTMDWLAEQAGVARGWRVARVRAAEEIGEDEASRLVTALGRLTGSEVELQVTIDPSLLGGVVVTVGDVLVDASASHRLELLGERLLTVGISAETPSLGNH